MLFTTELQGKLYKHVALYINPSYPTSYPQTNEVWRHRNLTWKTTKQTQMKISLNGCFTT